TGSGSPGRLLGEKCRRLFEQLPLHPQLSDLAAQPAQLLPLAAGQPLKLALVNAVLFDPLAQRLAVEPQLSCDLGDGLVAAAHQRHRVTAELGWIDACHPEPPLDGPAANSRGVRETGSTPTLELGMQLLYSDEFDQARHLLQAEAARALEHGSIDVRSEALLLLPHM